MTPRPRYTLRLATEDDSAVLYALHRAALGPCVEAVYGPWDDEVQQQFHAAWLAQGRAQVIETSEGIVGVVDWSVEADHVGVGRIAIDPAHQGRGLGTAVLTEILDRAADLGLPTRLEVFDINPARVLYERLGFVEERQVGRKVHLVRLPTT